MPCIRRGFSSEAILAQDLAQTGTMPATLVNTIEDLVSLVERYGAVREAFDIREIEHCYTIGQAMMKVVDAGITTTLQQLSGHPIMQ